MGDLNVDYDADGNVVGDLDDGWYELESLQKASNASETNSKRTC